MSAKTMFAKIAFSLAGLLILSSIGFNIYQYQRNKKLITKPVQENIGKNESTNDSDITSKPVSAINTVPLKKEGAPSGDARELESQLNMTEEELDETSGQLSEELAKKSEFKKAYEQFSKNMASNPAYKKAMNESTKRMVQEYDPLFKKLNISEEEFKEFKAIQADRMKEIQDAVLPNIVTASDEERAKMNQQMMEINNKYREKINEFLGEEKSSIYVSYRQSLSERSSLSDFLKTVSPDNRISEEQTEALIDSMYAARKAVYDEMGPDMDMNSSASFTEENIAHQLEKSKKVYDKYIEACRGVLPDDQVEQYKNYFKETLDLTESMLKTRMFITNKK